ncbi:hypothetical protein [Tahibacter caeni]|uniref:hypothetical protein n=1 Tax=Tahibacter caeni TaxID=1453545 RepID=UPI002147BC6C|nr:hypothetical protein [Tahibacter caeni]
MSAFAEGSRTLYPSTYNAAGSRGVMDASNATNFAGVAAGNQFLYVYARAGEYILLGSRNRSNGGDIFVYNPQSFGPKGSETIPGTANFSCSSQSGAGTIASRLQELAGPNSANGSFTVTDGFTPCSYVAPTTGIYGVRFTGATGGGATNNASVATPQILQNNLTSAWDVTVRADASSLVDLNGRLFTYAWTIYNNANGRQLFNDLYYVSLDGYRYRQSFRGLDPNRAAFYANAAGFIDTNGSALYHDYRGANAAATGGPSGTAGVTAQPPQYPIFFSDVSPTGPNNTEVNRVLSALAIPAVPAAPQLNSPTFVGNLGGNSSTYSTGGIFTFNTVNTLTYEIVVSRDGVDFDPANPLNRVLTGIALTGTHSVLWDGRDNSNTPFPAGNYTFRITGRNGEIHFPMVDVEGNVKGGPTLAKLNGSQDTTVYYDDRGHRAANGSLIGVLNGHLCGAGSAIAQPVPSYSLLGVDSANANLGGTGNYYRSWGGSNDNNTDCNNSANEYFGTAKGLDLWALEKTPQFNEPVVIVPPTTGVDVTTQVSVSSSVISGGTAYGSFVFSNAGDTTATGVSYTVALGNPATPTTCPAAVTFSLVPGGVTPTYNPAPTCTITFTGMSTSLTPGQSLTFNFNYVVAPTNPGPIPITTTIAATNETAGAPAPNTATAQTLVAKPIIDVVKSSTPAPGSQVNVGDTITYTLDVTVANAPLTSTLTLADALGTGLTFGSVTSAGSFSCSGSLTCTLPSGTATGTYSVTYTATVNSSAVGSVANNVVPSGGGGTNPPTCGPCSVTHNLPPPVISVAKTSNPASGTAVSTGQTITYTLTATVTGGTLSAPLVLTDTLSANQTFGTVTSAGAYTCTGSVQCTLPVGTAPGTYAVSYTATVNANATGTVGNNVAATGGGGNPPTCTTCSTTHPLTPAVTVVKTSNPASGASVSAGQTITYTLTATVTNAALSAPLVLTDTLSANQTFGTVTSAGAYTCTGSVQCTLPVGTAPGTYAVSYTATVNANATGTVGNTVAATGGGGNPPTCTTCSTTHPLSPAIAVVKTSNPASGAAVTAGQTITYTLTATVTNAALTAPLVLTDTLSANQTFGTVTSAGAYSCTGSVQCTLPSGTTPGTYAVSYTATVNTNATGTVGNNVAATGGGGNPPTCTSCSTTHPLNPAVTVVKTSNPASGAAVSAGQTITYTLTATVTNAALSAPLVLTDTLSANQTFGTVTSAGAYSCTGSVQCTLPSGTTPGTYAVSYTATVNTNATGTVGNTVAAAGGGGNPPDCTSCSTTHPLNPAVTVVKTSNPASGTAVIPGQTITYTLTATVTNAALTAPLVLTDTISANQTFGTVTSAGAYTCTGSVQCTLPSGTTPGAYAVSYTATVNANAAGSVNNNVTATGGGGNPPTCTTCSTTHLLDPAVSVVKTSNPAGGTVVSPGQTITYTLTATVTNGALTAPLVLTDTISANQTFGTVTSAGAYTCTGTVQCTLPIGTSPGTYAVSYTATVNANATGSVNNNVVATGGGGSNPPDCTSCGTTHPLNPAVTVVKTSNPTSGTVVTPGQTITYTLTATVTAGSLSAPLVLTDTISANQTFGAVTSAGAYSCTGSVQCTLPSGTAPGTYAVSYTATVNANAAGSVGNSVVATGGGTNPPDCTSCSTTHPLDPAVTVVKTSNPAGGTAVLPGQTITYTLTATVTNGTLTSPLVLTDTISANQTFGTVTSAGAYTCTGSVQCTLPSGTTPGTYAVSYTATVNANAAGSVGNTVAATGGGGSNPPDCTSCSTTHPLSPVVAVVKTSNPASGTAVIPGQTITYTLTATVANGTLTAPLVLTDTISANQTFGTVTSAGAYTCTGTVQCTLPSGTTPGTYAVSYTATVNANAAGSVNNNVVATGGGGSNPPDCTTCSTAHPLDPAVTVVKTSNPASGTAVIPGQTITYTLTATVANGTLTAPLVLTDTISANQTFGTVTSAGAYTCTGTVQCTLPSGTTPGTYAVSYTATVNANAAGSVNNNVTATGGGGSNPPDCTTCSTTHPLNPGIAVVKTSNPASGTAVLPGQTITYTLTATVVNGALSAPLVLTDTLSANQTFGSVTSAGAYTCTGTVQCTLPSGTAPGTYAVSYTATVNANATGTVGNVVAATGGGGTNPPDCTSCSTTHPLDPVVTVVKSSNPASGAAVAAGQTITYTLTATVANAALTAPLVLTDTLSANQTFGAVTSAGAYTCTGSVQCTLASGTAPGTYAVSYTATVNTNATGTVGNTVVATGGGGSNPPDCTSCGTTHPLNPGIVVVKTSNPASGTAVSAGQTITYTVTATVANAALSAPLVLTDTLSANQTFGSVTSAGAYSCTGSVQCTLASGTAPGTYAVSYTATVNTNATGTVGNVVVATGGGGSNPPDCTSCSTTHSLNPVVSVVKSSNPASGTTVTPGQTITYTVTATVANAALTAPLVLADTISANQTFGAVTSAGAYTCTGAVQCTLPSGTVPGTYAVSYTATVNANATGSVNNSVAATGGGGTNPPDCTSCSTTHPLQADVRIVKTLSSESGSVAGVAEPGETLVYTIALSNSGGAAAQNVGVTDPLDQNVVFVSASNGGAASGGNVLWSGLTVPPGGNLNLTVTVTVADPLPAGVTQVVNLAYETGTTPPNCSSMPLPPECVTIPTAANVAVTKALSGESGAQPGVAEPGETLTYTITLANSGGTAATNVGATDRIDANTSFVSADNGGTFAAGLVSWSGLSIPAGGSLQLTVVVQVASPIPLGVSQVANLAYLTGTTPPACPPAGPQCVLTPTEQSPRLQVTKTVNTTTVAAGGTATYTVTVTNVGTIPANNVIVDDALPAGIVGFIWTCSGSGGAVCPAASGTGALYQTVPQLPVGASLIYTITAQISATASGNLLNTVVVSPSSNTVCMPSGQPGPCNASVPLVVLGSTPVPAPALGWFAMLLMMLALAALAWRQHERRMS